MIDGWEVQELWGVAGRLAKRLAAMGIQTAGELTRAPRELLRRQLGAVGERMGLELQGVSCLELETMVPPRQNLCCSRSFSRPVEGIEELREAVATHMIRAGEKLRRQRLAARGCAMGETVRLQSMRERSAGKSVRLSCQWCGAQ